MKKIESLIRDIAKWIEGLFKGNQPELVSVPVRRWQQQDMSIPRQRCAMG
jgi:hypothetical protein